MKILGIIGGIGSGKTTVSECFQQHGVPAITADAIGHQVLLLPEIKQAVRTRWGEAIFDDLGEIDRRKMAAVVFANSEAAKTDLAYLKSLTHPRIAEEVHRQKEQYRQAGVSLCIFDAPLLLESGWEHLVDMVLFVDAPSEVRWIRVRDRGWERAEWERREAAQLSLAEKSRRSDVILDNSGNVEHLQKQIAALCLAKLH